MVDLDWHLVAGEKYYGLDRTASFVFVVVLLDRLCECGSCVKKKRSEMHFPLNSMSRAQWQELFVKYTCKRGELLPIHCEQNKHEKDWDTNIAQTTALYLASDSIHVQ